MMIEFTFKRDNGSVISSGTWDALRPQDCQLFHPATGGIVEGNMILDGFRYLPEVRERRKEPIPRDVLIDAFVRIREEIFGSD